MPRRAPEPAKVPAGPTLVDTHCHLGDDQFAADRRAVLARARAAGVRHVVIIADSRAATAEAIRLATEYDLSATAGVHPHQASSWSDETAAAVSAALDDPTVVAVGETGLDYHYDHSPRDAQRRAFEAQMRLAMDAAKPVVVHAREADDDMAAMLREWETVPAIVLHSFSSGDGVLEAGLAVGAYFSFSGMITFRNWAGDAAVRACPADRLMLETDAPYLAPAPHRGERNEPAFLPYIAARAAELRGIAAATLAEATVANAAACFGPRVSRGLRTDA